MTNFDSKMTNFDTKMSNFDTKIDYISAALSEDRMTLSDLDESMSLNVRSYDKPVEKPKYAKDCTYYEGKGVKDGLFYLNGVKNPKTGKVSVFKDFKNIQ